MASEDTPPDSTPPEAAGAAWEEMSASNAEAAAAPSAWDEMRASNAEADAPGAAWEEMKRSNEEAGGLPAETNNEEPRTRNEAEVAAPDTGAPSQPDFSPLRTPSLNDPQYRSPSLNDPGHRSPSLNDPKYRSPSLADSAVSLNDPEHRSPSLNDPKYRSASLNDPEHRTPSLNDPEHRSASLADPKQPRGGRERERDADPARLSELNRVPAAQPPASTGTKSRPSVSALPPQRSMAGIVQVQALCTAHSQRIQMRLNQSVRRLATHRL